MLLFVLFFGGAVAPCGHGLTNEATHFSKLAGILPSDTAVVDGKSAAEFIMTTPYIQMGWYFSLDRNPKQEEEPYKAHRLALAGEVFSDTNRQNLEKDGKPAGKTVYSGPDQAQLPTTLCFGAPGRRDYQFTSKDQSWYCLTEKLVQYDGSDHGYLYFYMIQNACTADTIPRLPTGPVMDGPFPTDVENPAYTFIVLKKFEGSSEEKRTLKVYSDGTLAYFKGTKLKGSLYVTAAPYWAKKEDSTVTKVDNKGAAGFLQMENRRMKDGVVKTDKKFRLKKDTNCGDCSDLDEVKAALDTVLKKYEANLEFCRSCPAEFVNIAVPAHMSLNGEMKSGVNDKFENAIGGGVGGIGFHSEVASFQEEKSGELGASGQFLERTHLVLVALTSILFAVYLFAHCFYGKTDVDSRAYNKLLEDEI